MKMSQLYRAFEIFKKYNLNPDIFLEACDNEFIYINISLEDITGEDISILEQMDVFADYEANRFYFMGQ